MAIVFAARGDSFDARYSTGGKTGVKQNSAKITTAAGGISGTVWDLTDTTQVKSVIFPGAYNTSNSRAMSILLRIAPAYTGTPAASRALGNLNIGLGTVSAYIEWSHATTTGNFNVTGKNELGANTFAVASVGAWSPTSGTYYDVVWTWDGTTTANAGKLYIDASLMGAGLTAGAALTSSWTNQYFKSIVIGAALNVTTSAYKYDEIVIWDSVIDPTSVTLESGSGSLNGASRTSLVSVAAFDGQSNSAPAVGDVRNGTAYTVAGTGYTGTLVVPTAANVKTGVTFETGSGTTGTYDGSDRWSDPTEACVKTGVAYKANSTSNNKTGTYTGSDRWSDPGVANVKKGVAYKADSTTNNRTGTLISTGGIGGFNGFGG